MNAFFLAQIVWLTGPQAVAVNEPVLAPQCICTPDQPCPCGKACQCVPAQPKPVVSVLKPKLSEISQFMPSAHKSNYSITSNGCPNGQCQIQLQGSRTPAPLSPVKTGDAHLGSVFNSCPGGQCTQAPASKPAGSERPASNVTGAGACSSCSQGTRYSQPVRRGLFGWGRR